MGKRKKESECRPTSLRRRDRGKSEAERAKDVATLTVILISMGGPIGVPRRLTARIAHKIVV